MGTQASSEHLPPLDHSAIILGVVLVQIAAGREPAQNPLAYSGLHPLNILCRERRFPEPHGLPALRPRLFTNAQLGAWANDAGEVDAARSMKLLGLTIQTFCPGRETGLPRGSPAVLLPGAGSRVRRCLADGLPCSGLRRYPSKSRAPTRLCLGISALRCARVETRRRSVKSSDTWSTRGGAGSLVGAHLRAVRPPSDSEGETGGADFATRHAPGNARFSPKRAVSARPDVTPAARRRWAACTQVKLYDESRA
jgi:hypothetical protein